MSDREKLEWIHFAIQEAINGNLDELNQAIEFVEDIREKNFRVPVEVLEKAGDK